jgi:hypothetical protein
MKDTVPQLMTRIVTATQRVLFLLDSTILLKEDIQLNTRVFHWPKGNQDWTVLYVDSLLWILILPSRAYKQKFSTGLKASKIGL